MKKRVFSVLLIIALLVAVGVVTAQADPAEIIAAANQMDFSADTGSGVVMNCPVCGTEKTWTALTSAGGDPGEAGHFYVPEGGITLSSRLVTGPNDAAVRTYCIHLNGQILTGGSAGSTIYQRAKATLNILGDGNITGYSGANELITGRDASINIYGGTLAPAAGETYPVVNSAAGTVNVYGGTVAGKLAISGAGTVGAYGGQISSIVPATNTATINVSGAPTVGFTDLSAGGLLTVGELAEGAAITVNAYGVFTNELADANAVKGYFAVKDGRVEVEGNTLKAVSKTIYEKAVAMDFSDASNLPTYCPACSATGVTWTALTSDIGSAQLQGHYYLADETVDIGANHITVGTANGQTLCVHLNGNALTGGNGNGIFSMRTCVLNVMGDGTVTGGASAGRVFNTNAGTINIYGGTYGVTSGRTVWSNGAGTVTLHEGTIDGTNGAFAVYLNNGATFAMNGGTVTGARIYADNASAVANTININGGTVSSGVGATLANLTITGGTINQVDVSSDSTVAASGNPVVSLMNLADNFKITVGELTQGAAIAVKSNGVFTEDFADETAATAAKVFFTAYDAENMEIKLEGMALTCAAKDGGSEPVEPEDPEEPEDPDPELSIYENAIAMDFSDANNLPTYCPACNATDVTWTALTSDIGSAQLKGHYYLADESVDIGANHITVGTANGQTLCVNLNGKTLTGGNGNGIFSLRQCVLNVMGDGAVTGGASATRVFNTNNGTVNLYGGDYTTTKEASRVVWTEGTGTVTLHEGTITGLTDSYAVYLNRGGAFVMNGGTVNGSNIYGSSLSGETNTVTINAGTVSTSVGSDSVNLTITGGTVNQVEGGSVVIVSGGTIDLIDVSSYGRVTVSGGTIDLIDVQSYATVTVSGGTINQIDIHSNKAVTVSGKPVIGLMTILEGYSINVGTLETGASITVDARGVFTPEFADAAAAEAALPFFCAYDAETYEISVSGLALTSEPEGGFPPEYFLGYYIQDGEAVITCWNRPISGNFIIPDTLGGYPVTTIDNYALAFCDTLFSITIPDSVTAIGECAFDSSGLQSITIGKGVTYIDDSAFNYCSGLNGIWVDSQNETYSSDEYGVLFNKDKTELILAPGAITTYAVPDSVTTIGDSAFSDCTNLQSITIGNSVTTIGNSAFAYCRSLQSLTIPDSVITIGDHAFSYCTGLQSITIGNSVTTIGDYAFDYCRNLQSLTIPDSVTTIGDYAFYDCTNLQSITIGKGVASIGDYAFRYCTGITGIWVDSQNESYSNDAYGVLFNKNKTELIKASVALTTYTIPDSVTTIKHHAFRSCVSLQNVTIPDSVTNIDNAAFSYCESLQSITIPDGVTTICDFTFYNNKSLQSIIVPDSVTTIGDDAFYSCDSLTDVYYAGTLKQWIRIDIGAYNEDLELATLHITESSEPDSTPSIYEQAKEMDFSDAENLPTYCPACGATEGVTWTALTSEVVSGNTSGIKGHYYLADDSVDIGVNHITVGTANNQTLCLNLNGNALTGGNGNGIFSLRQCILNVMGDGTVTGGASASRVFNTNSGTINIYGGTYTTTVSGSRVVWTEGTGTVTLNEGAINGVNGTFAVYLNRGATFVMNGGSVVGARVYSDDIGENYNNITVNGGRISEGISGKACNLVVTGGVIDQISVSESIDATISGDPYIRLLDIPEGLKITVGELKTDAEIIVNASGVFTNELADANAVKGYFTSANEDTFVVVAGNALSVGIDMSWDTVADKIAAANEMDFSDANNLPTYCPACGATEVAWTALTSDIGSAQLQGHYYLADESVDIGANHLTVGNTNGQTLCVHLNGKTLTGGNVNGIFSMRTCTLNVMGDGTVTGGASAGRVFSTNLGTINLYGGTYNSTKAAARTVWSQGSGTLNLYEGTINGLSDGFAVYLNNGATFNMEGGTVCGARLYTDNNNSTNVNTVTINGGTVEYIGVTQTNLTITGGTIGQIDVATDSTVVLSGDSTIGVLAIPSDAETNPALTVTEDFAGTVTLRNPVLGTTETTTRYGLAILGANSGSFTGEVYATFEEDANIYHVLPTEANGLQIASTCVVNGETETWFVDTASAVAAANDGGYVKLYTGDIIVLSGDVITLDLNGQFVTITGTGTITGFDSATDTFVVGGEAYIANTITVNTPAKELVGKNTVGYIKLVDAETGATTFNYYEMRLSGVSIKPETAGVYYKAIWSTNSLLKANMYAGIVVSVANAPTETFYEEFQALRLAGATTGYEDFFYAYIGNGITNGQAMTGVLVDGIMKATNDPSKNAKNGQGVIYANAFIKVGDQIILSDGKAMSIYDILNTIDGNQALYNANRSMLTNFYNKWMNYLPEDSWLFKFERIGKAA